MVGRCKERPQTGCLASPCDHGVFMCSCTRYNSHSYTFHQVLTHTAPLGKLYNDCIPPSPAASSLAFTLAVASSLLTSVSSASFLLLYEPAILMLLVSQLFCPSAHQITFLLMSCQQAFLLLAHQLSSFQPVLSANCCSYSPSHDLHICISPSHRHR